MVCRVNVFRQGYVSLRPKSAFMPINGLWAAASFAAMLAWSPMVCSQAAAPSVPGQAQPSAPALIMQSLRFTIAEIRVSGNTLIPDAPLRAVLKQFVGSGKTLDDLNRAREAIVDMYREEGYELFSVDYNAQRSREGIHGYVVREVKVGKVSVSGNSVISSDNLRRQLPSLEEGKTPRLEPLARELFLLNDNAARSVVLSYAPSNPGVTDVEVKVTEKPQLHADLALNNTGSSATGASRLGITVYHDNLFDRSHQLSLGAVTSPEQPGRVRQFSIGYQVPLAALGDRLVFSASDSSTDSGLVANLFNVSGRGSTVALHYVHNLARDALSRHTLELGYDERRFRDVVDFFGVNLGTSVTTRPLSLAYRYGRTAQGDNLTLGLALQRNLPGGDVNDDTAYGAARVGALAQWHTWQLDASWQRELASGWMPSVRVNSQFTPAPLISAEQFGVGGFNAVRGFDEREGAGDSGWHARGELFGPRLAENHRLLGFVDLGASTRLNPQPGELASQELGSYGLGWRAQFTNGLGISADAAVVFRGTASHPAGSTRLHFAAVWSF